MRVLFHPAVCALALVAGLMALVFGCTADPQGDSKREIKLDAVKVKAFEKALQAHKGKVVVLDVWADFCIPCKEEFPNLVRLHQQYGKDGLVCISISVDEPEGHAGALKFLKKVKATFPNYRFDFQENAEWQDHFNIKGPPAVFVYGRDGKLAARFDHNDVDKTFTYKDVENTVKKLLPAGK